MYNIFIIHSSTDNLSCFYVLTIMNKMTMNVVDQVSLKVGCYCVFSLLF